MDTSYQLTADDAREMTTPVINRELRDVFKQIRSAAEKGKYAVDISYNKDFNNSEYARYRRRLEEMGYDTYNNRDRKIMIISW